MENPDWSYYLKCIKDCIHIIKNELIEEDLHCDWGRMLLMPDEYIRLNTEITDKENINECCIMKAPGFTSEEAEKNIDLVNVLLMEPNTYKRRDMLKLAQHNAIDALKAFNIGDIPKSVQFYGTARFFLGVSRGSTTAFFKARDQRSKNFSKIARQRHEKNRAATQSTKDQVLSLWRTGHPTEQRGWRTITEAAGFAVNHLPGVKFRTAQKWISEASKKP